MKALLIIMKINENKVLKPNFEIRVTQWDFAVASSQTNVSYMALTLANYLSKSGLKLFIIIFFYKVLFLL